MAEHNALEPPSCLGGTARDGILQLQPKYTVFVTNLDNGLINGPSTRIWHRCGRLSEPCSAHVGDGRDVNKAKLLFLNRFECFSAATSMSSEVELFQLFVLLWFIRAV